MIKIEIHDEVEDEMAMVDLLNHIATLVKEGYTSGINPNWDIRNVEVKEKTIN